MPAVTSNESPGKKIPISRPVSAKMMAITPAVLKESISERALSQFTARVAECTEFRLVVPSRWLTCAHGWRCGQTQCSGHGRVKWDRRGLCRLLAARNYN